MPHALIRGPHTRTTHEREEKVRNGTKDSKERQQDNEGPTKRPKQTRVDKETKRPNHRR